MCGSDGIDGEIGRFAHLGVTVIVNRCLGSGEGAFGRRCILILRRRDRTLRRRILGWFSLDWRGMRTRRRILTVFILPVHRVIIRCKQVSANSAITDSSVSPLLYSFHIRLLLFILIRNTSTLLRVTSDIRSDGYVRYIAMVKQSARGSFRVRVQVHVDFELGRNGCTDCTVGLKGKGGIIKKGCHIRPTQPGKQLLLGIPRPNTMRWLRTKRIILVERQGNRWWGWTERGEGCYWHGTLRSKTLAGKLTSGRIGRLELNLNSG